MLEINDLCVNYGMLEAVKHVSMEVPEGRVVSLLGANGSGKSTILKTVSGLKAPRQGEIFFGDKKVDGMEVDAIVDLGISHIPEGRRLFPYMTVLENPGRGILRRGACGHDGQAASRFAHHAHRRNRKIDSRGFWRPEKQPEYTLTRPPSCPKRRSHLMKAAVLYDFNTPLQIERFDLPKIEDDQVRVRLEASGVCHSDWHIVKGEWIGINRPPVILGHEGAGVVEEIGSAVHNVKVGDHVVLSWKRNCGLCEMCQVGYPNLCEEPWDHRGQPRFPDSERPMKRMNGLGTFSTETIVPQDIAIPIDPEIPFSQAALVGCGVMTGVGAALNTANVQPGRSVAVFGCGGVGLNVIQGAVIAGAEPIIAVDILDNKLEMGKLFGATHTVNSARVDPVEAIQELTDGKGVHYAFEAIGLIPEPYRQAILCTRSRGVTVLVGHAPDNTRVDFDARMLMLEKTVIGSLYGTCRPRIDFSRLFSLYKAGKLKLDELVTRVYPLERVNEAFDALGKGEVARSVLDLR